MPQVKNSKCFRIAQKSPEYLVNFRYLELLLLTELTTKIGNQKKCHIKTNTVGVLRI